MDNEWRGGLPKLDVLVEVKVDDFSGGYAVEASRKRYIKPPRKGMRKDSWRWVDKNGNPMHGKDKPSLWRPLTRFGE